MKYLKTKGKLLKVIQQISILTFLPYFFIFTSAFFFIKEIKRHPVLAPSLLFCLLPSLPRDKYYLKTDITPKHVLKMYLNVFVNYVA